MSSPTSSNSGSILDKKNVADLNQLIGKEKGILAPDFFGFFKNAINQYGYLLAALVGLLVLLFWFIKPAKVSQELQAQPQNNLPNEDQLALQSHSPSSNQEPIPSNDCDDKNKQADT